MMVPFIVDGRVVWVRQEQLDNYIKSQKQESQK